MSILLLYALHFTLLSFHELHLLMCEQYDGPSLTVCKPLLQVELVLPVGISGGTIHVDDAAQALAEYMAALEHSAQTPNRR